MSLHVTSVVIDGNEKAVFLVELRDLAKISLEEQRPALFNFCLCHLAK